MTQIRIGIDVGGTFTDAVAIDTTTFEVLDQVKVPTTHDAGAGVAAGIVEAASTILESVEATPADVVFIAHGTTQATNALLEGDVAKVGVLGMGRGLKGRRGRSETQIDTISLDNDQTIETEHGFVMLDDGVPTDEIEPILERFADKNVEAVVVSQAFGVDDPTAENAVCDLVTRDGLAAIGANVVSKRYGLKVRTRTAVVNGSILPRMIETSRSTVESIGGMGIDAPLMIMRSDGGVMEIEEMQRRPIQTILSGPAAGVAGALMYENITDGIFIEVGGTSSDISVIEKGQPKWKAAEIGGHTTFLRTLDIRTEGIAGGSMIRLDGDKIAEVGPRSAHIADIPYAVYADPDEIQSPSLVRLRPKPNDPEYVGIETANGNRYALTPSGAANLLGYVDETAYAAGNPEAARRAFEPLADELGVDVETAAEMVLDASIGKIIPVIESIVEEYDLDPKLLELVGGGGGSAALVPYLAATTPYEARLAHNHETISTIGVGLAMVRDVIERNVMDPGEDEIQQLRREAIDSVVGMGASQETVEAKVEYDSSRNLLRAEAEGSTELQTRDLSQGTVDEAELRETAASSLDAEAETIEKFASIGGLSVYQSQETSSKFFGLISSSTQRLAVLDESGVVKLKLNDAEVYKATGELLTKVVDKVLDEESVFSNASAKLPNLYICHGNQLLDVSGISSREQIHSLLDVEFEEIPDSEQLLILAEKP
ncbi:hydantoinase/oxoprolinase family protein [Haladaptatus caseinilyticus]|uniref:hydantoinase/oxoprolinase family protein n=1 Tax=Haladaptatus caseinilyticus TaxID=2993314 RepID=UPI00224AABE4|nr:hydantoinase/oxoprolinase family protein [Haladaptatus caseinilyticus]